MHKWRALLVTKSLDGFEEIERWYEGGGRERHGEAVHDRVLKDLAENLARMHKGALAAQLHLYQARICSRHR